MRERESERGRFIEEVRESRFDGPIMYFRWFQSIHIFTKKKKDFDYCWVLLGGILKHCIVPQQFFNKVNRLIVLKFLSSVECYHINFWLVSLVWRSWVLGCSECLRCIHRLIRSYSYNLAACRWILSDLLILVGSHVGVPYYCTICHCWS